MATKYEWDSTDKGIAAVALFVGWPLSIAYCSWITVKLWAWFVVPTFEGAPSLTLAVAAGLYLLVSHLRPITGKNDPTETAAAVLGRAVYVWFMHPTILLIVATAVRAWFL